jgi:nitrite transporter NirC
MPTAIPDALTELETLAETKAAHATQSPLTYALSSVLAGAYVGVAVLVLTVATAGLVVTGSPATTIVQGGVFGIALILVFFAGAELFTENAMVMTQGFMASRASLEDLSIVLAGSLLGNLAGSFVFAAVASASGVLDAGPIRTGLGRMLATKDSLAPGQLFFRAVVCNMLVALGVWMATRAKGDIAKLAILWWALLAFVVAGFEHAVANMTLFALGVLGHAPGAGWGMLWRNLLFTVPGNLVGGAAVVGAAYATIGRAEREKQESVVANGRKRPLTATR